MIKILLHARQQKSMIWKQFNFSVSDDGSELSLWYVNFYWSAFKFTDYLFCPVTSAIKLS